MHVTPDNRLKKLIIIGDRVLIRPTRPNERTQTGLYLPPGVQEKEKVQQGYIIKSHAHLNRRFAASKKQHEVILIMAGNIW